mgnify:CR=1 FL=1
MTIVLELKKKFKGYLLAGTIVLLPLIGTLLILKTIIIWADELIISLLPDRIQPNVLLGYSIPGIGLIVTFVVILAVGVLTRLYFGRKLVQIGDSIISKIPLARGIYSAIKKLMATVMGKDSDRFKSVVAIEFPRKGLWSIGFVTGDAINVVQSFEERKYVNVFVPTTPNPTSGFLVMSPKEELKPLSISIESAFKLIISGGIIKDIES